MKVDFVEINLRNSGLTGLAWRREIRAMVARINEELKRKGKPHCISGLFMLSRNHYWGVQAHYYVRPIPKYLN